jgi:tetratricopeptide (TPR) repeat protein
MSTHPLHCRTCNRECVYERCAPFGEGQEGAYAVAWRCPDGHGVSLDVCPVGPLVPSPGLCLNCGNRYSSDAADAADADCGACGLSRGACPAALGLGEAHAVDPITNARATFAQGLFRRGMAILNQALQHGSELLEAWFLKADFLNSLGFNCAAAKMLEGAMAKFTSPADRIRLLQEQSFLWAECQRGEEALRSADAATGLGSNSVRTHYLRGRALALLGRLEEAQDEMKHVLSFDAHNADAKRALGMIQAALESTPGRRWWQFWK